MIEAGVAPQDAEAAWDAVVGWVLHFFPDRFRQVVGKKGPMLSRSRVLA